MNNKKHYIEEEAFIVKHSGEIPEVAYHGSLHYLTSDEEGPRLKLDERDILPLKNMVVERYCEIIQRDLAPENRDKSIYRGLARSYANWERLTRFCNKEGFDTEDIRLELSQLLAGFLHNEAKEVHAGHRTSCINVTCAELQRFIDMLGVIEENLPADLADLCLPNNVK